MTSVTRCRRHSATWRSQLRSAVGIGLRILLTVAAFAVSIAFLTYLFTRKPHYLELTKNLMLLTALFVGILGVIYLVERFLYM